MKRKWRAASTALLGAAAVLLIAKAHAVPSSQQPDGELHYQSGCSVVDSNSVDGFVSNASQDTYQVRGEVRFKFVLANSIGRPEIVSQADSLIPGGETVRVAHVRLSFALRPNEACVLDLAGAIRKE